MSQSPFNVDPARVGLGGRSDGAGYALSMGLAARTVFLAHGTNDRQMPIDMTGRKFSAQLKSEGYDVTCREYEGGHATPSYVAREAFAWLVGAEPKGALSLTME